MMLFRVLLISALFHFLGAKSVFGIQKWSKTLKMPKIRHFALFAKIASKVPKKVLSRATFLAHARFERFGAKRAKKCVLGRKSTQKRTFRTFWAKIAKIALLE